MKKQYIAVIDSGIGGISVLSKLVKTFPNEKFIYFGDNDNAPYGNLSRENLLKVVLKGLDLVLSYDLKGIVLACNTLSVNLYKEISEYSALPIFCVFPPVEFCAMKKGKTLLLATDRTARNYSCMENLDCFGLKDLALIIEKNVFKLDTYDFNKYFSDVVCVKKSGYENVILGCTHYNFIKNQILVHFRPQNLYDGTENLIKIMKRHFQGEKSSVNNKCFNILFVGTNAKFNEYIYNISGQIQ